MFGPRSTAQLRGRRAVDTPFIHKPVAGKRAKGLAVTVEGNRVAGSKIRGGEKPDFILNRAEEQSYGIRSRRTPDMAFVHKPVQEKSYGIRPRREGNVAFVHKPVAEKSNAQLRTRDNKNVAFTLKPAAPMKGPSSNKQQPKAKPQMSEFGRAFAGARKTGAKEFTYKGKQYHTRRADETTQQWSRNMASRRTPNKPKTQLV